MCVPVCVLHFHINLLHLLLFSIYCVCVHGSMMPLGSTGKKFQFSISCHYPYLSLHFALLSTGQQAKASNTDSVQYYVYVCGYVLFQKHINNLNLHCEIDRKIAQFVHWEDIANICRKDYKT